MWFGPSSFFPPPAPPPPSPLHTGHTKRRCPELYPELKKKKKQSGEQKKKRIIAEPAAKESSGGSFTNELGSAATAVKSGGFHALASVLRGSIGGRGFGGLLPVPTLVRRRLDTPGRTRRLHRRVDNVLPQKRAADLAMTAMAAMSHRGGPGMGAGGGGFSVLDSQGYPGAGAMGAGAMGAPPSPPRYTRPRTHVSEGGGGGGEQTRTGAGGNEDEQAWGSLSPNSVILSDPEMSGMGAGNKSMGSDGMEGGNSGLIGGTDFISQQSMEVLMLDAFRSDNPLHS